MRQHLRLLDLLADGRFHSGRALGASLGIGRSAVCKQVRKLEAQGFDIYAVRGRGYRLATPVERLDGERIRAALSAPVRERVGDIEVLAEVDSTNRRLAARAAAATPGVSICVAECQSAGRGRRGRQWLSPYGRNLYLSLLWRFTAPSRALRGLSLAVGVTVAQALEAVGVRGIALKWPNDLVGRQGKVGGILVELSGEPGGPTSAVIGVGLNVDMPAVLRAAIDQPVSDLNTEAATRISRNALAGAVIEALCVALPRFERGGFAAFRGDWAARDLSRDRAVVVEGRDGRRAGRALGVDEDGALIVDTGEERIRVSSGDVTLETTP